MNFDKVTDMLKDAYWSVGIKKEEVIDITKKELKESTDISKKEKTTKIKKPIFVHKKQHSKINILESQNKTFVKNTDIQNKKISLISRIWHAIKAPFTSFLFNLGF